MPGTVQAVAACTTAPDGWGRGGDGGVARVGHDAAGEGHHACLALYGGTRPSYALCDIGGTQALHRLWPGRECGAAWGQSAPQGPTGVLVGKHGPWDCGAGGRRLGWEVGHRYHRGDDGHLSDTTTLAMEQH